MRIRASGRGSGRLAALLTILVLTLLVSACTDRENTNPTGDERGPGLIGIVDGELGFPHDIVTVEGGQSAALYLPVFLIAVVIFLLVEGLLLVAAFRFRRKSADRELPPQVHGNNRLEILWTAIPAVIVLVIFIGSTMVLADVESTSEEPGVIVDVQAFRFGWMFDYPDSGISIAGGGREGAPQMVLPVDEPIRFRVSAADVIHSFYVPSFFFKRDAVPGRVNEFELTISEPGVYGGQCAEFCGLAHAEMFFTVRAVERAEYDVWVDEQIGGQPSPAPEGSPATSPAPEGSPATTPGPEGSPATSPGPDSSPPVEGAVLEIATVADAPLAFTTASLEAPAGETVTLRYRNDSAIPHNVAVFDGPDADSPVMAATEIITGPDAETEISFQTPETPGAYYFHCDVHPTQMQGTLEVVS